MCSNGTYMQEFEENADIFTLLTYNPIAYMSLFIEQGFKKAYSIYSSHLCDTNSGERLNQGGKYSSILV